MSTEVVKEKGLTSFQVAGNDVKLSYDIVKKFLVKGSGEATEQDLTLFISLCKFNQLNPFLNEAYLVKYGTEPATMVVSKEAILKRADSCETYDGIESGLIVKRGEVGVDIEGGCKLDGDVIIGAWAKTYRKDRKYPSIARVQFDEYVQVKKDGSVNKFWSTKPATMIIKVAEMQSLRKAFPSQLGAMYSQEEQTVDIEHEDISERKVTHKVIEQKEPEKVDLAKL
jgi:phage recombination protein Bet